MNSENLTCQFSNAVEKWINDYRAVFTARRGNHAGPTIKVNDVTSKLSFLYEKIRNTVDYREDHLIRRHATARMLKRLATAGSKGSDIALPLIEEMIRARYLPNNIIPEGSVEEIKHIINKYIVIYNSAVDASYPPGELHHFFDWLINLAACEIEETLAPSPQSQITVEAVLRVVNQSLTLEGANELKEEQKKIQIYIAVLKSLLKADEMTVNYYLIKYHYPDWKPMTLSAAALAAVQIKQLPEIFKKNYHSYLNERLSREFSRYAVSFWILQEIIENNKQQYQAIFADKKLLEEKIKEVCAERYRHIGGKVRRAIFRSVIYIFLTKIMFGVILEFPYDYYILDKIHWLSLAINAVFPPFLMAAIGLSIRTPGQKNTEEIVRQITRTVYGKDSSEHIVKISHGRRGFIGFIIRILYSVMYLISFGLVIYILYQLSFSPASMIIFLLFLTLVSFFSLRIRRTAGELIVLEEKDRLFGVIATFLFIPILRVGRWLSIHSSKVNIFIFILDYILETPFKTFIRLFEDLIVFIKEKRDELTG